MLSGRDNFFKIGVYITVKKQTTALAIGRWMPIHLGHKQFLVDLAKKFDKLVIGIGSCYENGTARNCIPAIEREKLLRKILKKENVSNVVIVAVSDRPSFEEWFDDVSKLCQKYNVTHFCTGNKEDILNVMAEKGLYLDAELIDPETTSEFPYHATDIRNAILRGDLDLLDSMIPAEIKPMVLNQVAKEIEAAAMGQGQEFVPGRQTVDVILVVKNLADGVEYLLIGKRNGEKVDFPNTWAIPGGAIKPFELPTDAASQCFLEETGLILEVCDNSEEPATAVIKNLNNKIAKLHFIGIYASKDERINGTRGGGSQCFAMHVEGDIAQIKKVLNSTHDMVELKFADVDSVYKIDFAFDQKRMIFDALTRLGIPYNNGEMLQRFDEDGAPNGGVSRQKAHSEGILHGASHVFIYKWDNQRLMFLLQRRSDNKDSYPGALDISSAGHVEYGSNFLDTAVKELQEELGLSVSKESLRVMFTQRANSKHIFHNKLFLNKEINTVYALERDVDVHKLKLQKEEVSEVIWLSAEKILEELEKEDTELCMDPEEMKKAIEMLVGHK